MRKINKIIVHCTATPDGRRVTVDDVRKWHKERGFNDIGYHYLIGLDGIVQTGRPLGTVGAHTTGQNEGSIGIAYVGGLDANGKRPEDTRNTEQKAGLIRLVSELKKQFPNATIHGHNEFANKACPCFDVKKEFAL